MGCDIHMYIEIKKGNQWEYYNWERQFETGEFYEDGEPKINWDKVFDHPLYINRNYDLFAVLANVRNGYGFAGIPTGSGFDPISEPRGLPDDVNESIKAFSDRWGIDGHSHSWLILDELLAYDWDKCTVQFGLVTLNNYREFKESGKPKSWCGDALGGGVEKVSNFEMDTFLRNGIPDDGLDYYTDVSWNETYRDAVGEQWFSTMEYLKMLGKPSEIRLVFWFDN